MSAISKLLCGIILLTIPAIQYGGHFLLQLLSGKYSEPGLNSFQRSMFRAGHAHAGILVILSIIAQLLADYAPVPQTWEWIARLGFPLSAILIPAGFFGGAIGRDINRPTRLIWLLYVGFAVLFAALLVLGVGLIIKM